MSTIRCIYHSAPPDFPATDQHPDAVRYQVGDKWVDAIGGKPTQAEIDAVLNPPAPVSPTLDDVLAAISQDAGLQAKLDAVVAAKADT